MYYIMYCNIVQGNAIIPCTVYRCKCMLLRNGHNKKKKKKKKKNYPPPTPLFKKSGLCI